MRLIMKRPAEAFVAKSLADQGLGSVVVARFPGADAEAGVFLVDTYCQGAKDAFYARVPQSEFDAVTLDQILAPDEREAIDPPSVRKLVESAVAYARRLGFAPHPDYRKGCRVFGGIKAEQSTAQFTFGKDGKPCYVQGRHDSFDTCLRILRQLRSHCGADNFDFVVYTNEAQANVLEAAGFTIRQKFAGPPPEDFQRDPT
jgi:hypothetical protein